MSAPRRPAAMQYIDDSAQDADRDEHPAFDDNSDEDKDSAEAEACRQDVCDFDLPSILATHEPRLRASAPYRIPTTLLQAGAATPSRGEEIDMADLPPSRPVSPAFGFGAPPAQMQMSRAATPAYMPTPDTPFSIPDSSRAGTPLFIPGSRGPTPYQNGGVRPPPSRSPEPQSTWIESELSDSAESYGAGEAFKECVVQRTVARGYQRPRGIEDDDQDDLREFEKEIARHGFDDADAAPQSKKMRKTRSRTRSASGAASTASSDNDAADEESECVTTQQSKGKGKAVAAGRKRVSKKAEKKKAPMAYGVETTDEDATEGGDDEADDEGDDRDGSGCHKTGTVPQDILDRTVVALAVFEDTVAELAKACGKAPQTLHRLVGTATKKPRDMSGWNVWQRWHAVECPKHVEMTAAEYNQLSRSSFKQECTQRGLSPTEVSDSDAVFRALPWLLTWHTDLMDKVTEEWRDKGKFKSAMWSVR
ncbi:hypothetical protein C8R44DRAFT_745244 [Mycena epipterygia]|nr:hypothetical protein C8R44DRAFT_745244 [Mycena epipterygia]